VTAMLSVTVGMVSIALQMYLSTHDLSVLLWVAGVATVVSIGAALVLGHAYTRQAERVRAVARAVAEGRTVEGEDAIDRSELGELEAELARTSRRLEEARREVEAIDTSRRELIAWISHDLRTPLAGLRAMAEALEDGMADDPARFHRRMRAQVDRLSALVDDLFELAKIQSGSLTLQFERVALYDIVSDAVAELAPVAEARGVRIAESTSPGITVFGDARELARVVGNLLMNALQHSPTGSEIRVETSRDAEGQAMLTVLDAGGGIPDQDIARIFDAGWRAQTARTPEEPLVGRSTGAGLGLAIVQGIVHAHSGDVSARNVAGGCRFDVVLPVTAA
jgi:signal transduction histidine kinase